jgi:hypothetical protein
LVKAYNYSITLAKDNHNKKDRNGEKIIMPVSSSSNEYSYNQFVQGILQFFPQFVNLELFDQYLGETHPSNKERVAYLTELQNEVLQKKKG